MALTYSLSIVCIPDARS